MLTIVDYINNRVLLSHHHIFKKLLVYESLLHSSYLQYIHYIWTHISYTECCISIKSIELRIFVYFLHHNWVQIITIIILEYFISTSSPTSLSKNKEALTIICIASQTKILHDSCGF